MKSKKNMELKMNVGKLQEMVSRSIKGCSNNRLLPITQMMAIDAKNGQLTLITTDATNYLYIRESGIDLVDNFYVVVPAEQFAKLIARLTCENVELCLEDSALRVEGNGTYKIPLQYDENGKIVQYPDPLSEFEPQDSEEIKYSSILKVLTVLKPALAQTMEDPCYTRYYIGDKAISTNRSLINVLDIKLLKSPRLISSEMMDLLSVMTQEKISVEFRDKEMVFSTPDCVVYGLELDGIEEFAVSDIYPYLDIPFDSMCKVSRSILLESFNRLALFVNTYEEGPVNLIFTQEGIKLLSVTSDGVEIIPYTDSNNFIEFSCKVSVDMMLKQIKAQSGDTLEIWYGDESVLKFVDKNVIQLIALLEQ